MIRAWLATGGRAGVVWAVALVELALAWALAFVATYGLTGSLALHPLGARALSSRGGLLLGELAAIHARAWTPVTGLVAVAVLLHGAAWMLLGGMFPVVGANAGVRWHRAAAESLRRAPTLLGLAAIAGLGYALAGFAGYAAAGWAERTAAVRPDVRAAAVLSAAAWALCAALACAVSLWHDTARVQAMARGRGALPASGAAAWQIVREPIATAAAGAGFGLIAWGYIAAAWPLTLLFAAWGERPGALALLIGAQGLTVLGRVHARMKWFTWLGRRAALARERDEA